MAKGKDVGLMGRLERQVEGLSNRDRKLLLGLIAMLGIGTVVLFTWGTRGVLADKVAEVNAVRTTYAQVQAMQAEFVEAERSAKSQEATLKAYRNKPVSAYVEEVAGTLGILENLRSINAKGQPEVVGGIKQTTYIVEIQRAPSLESVVRFMYEVETSGFPASVASANIKFSKRRDTPQYSLKLDLMVYSLAEG
jgi:hypothetical protein